ncbi:UNVERIFIED_CONTAM: hypothetical protein Slati_0150900 [Sesamum latifolium]|uniref:Reverse transcriptase zinc-binding domain-containing protein n=1 Tax=Sesamum latifolium TaxID=2727402 RepID=A0AAW2YA23_9LAMI
MTAKFFWHGELEQRTHWVAWRTICQPLKDGGLGFRRLKEYNIALLAKQAWRVATNPCTLLHDILCHRYFPGANFLRSWNNAFPLIYMALVARCEELAGHRDQMEDWRWKVGAYCWPPVATTALTFQPIVRPRTLPEDAKVASLLNQHRDWNEELVRSEFLPSDAECILSIELQQTTSPDEIVWHFERKGKFTVKSGQVPPKVRMFAWRCAQGALPTSHNLSRRGIKGDENCVRCEGDLEDLSHVLFSCSFARLVWALSDLRMVTIPKSALLGADWLRDAHSAMETPDFTMFLATCWGLWYQRNQLIFEGKFIQAHEVNSMAKRLLVASLFQTRIDPG